MAKLNFKPLPPKTSGFAFAVFFIMIVTVFVAIFVYLYYAPRLPWEVAVDNV